MSELYPLKFETIFKEKIWGGIRLRDSLHKEVGAIGKCGESWEISGVQENISVVSNGKLAGNDLEELIEVYMGDLVGDKVYEKFGIEFPLLVKFIDANEDLSIQVHPDDQTARERHNAFGKTEMWVVVEADEGAEIMSGFNTKVDKAKYLEHINNGTLHAILNREKVSAGDVFFIPAGRIHAIGKGILLAEIQQTSDISYRIFDYNRKDNEGKERELHAELAEDVIDYKNNNSSRVHYHLQDNAENNLVDCKYFTTNLLHLTTPVERDIYNLDSFVIYLCLEGDLLLVYADDEVIPVKKGELILIPASLHSYGLIPRNQNASLIEVYIK